MNANYELPTTNFGKFIFTLGFNHFFTWKVSPGRGLRFENFRGNYNNGSFPLAPGAIPLTRDFSAWNGIYHLDPNS